MKKQLEGKVAVITGGGQGVGFGIAQEFVENGARVVLTGRRRAILDEAVAKLGRQSSAIVADVSKLSEMEGMFREAVAMHGRLDTVVANAITSANGPPRDDHRGAVGADLQHEREGRAVLGSAGAAIHVVWGNHRHHRLDRRRQPSAFDESLQWCQGCRALHGSMLDSGHQGVGHSDQRPERGRC